MSHTVQGVKPSCAACRPHDLCANLLCRMPPSLLLTQTFAVDIAALSLVDSERQWYKAKAGLLEVCSTDRQSAFGGCCTRQCPKGALDQG